MTTALNKYHLSGAAEELYDFVWHKLADKYIESVKDRREGAFSTLSLVLENTLKLLHPFMPFVTEAIWQETKSLRKESGLLITSSWPKI